MGTHLGISGDKKLHLRLGADHRADIAAIENRSGRLFRERMLERKQGPPYLGDLGDDGCGIAEARVAERRIVEGCSIKCRGGTGRIARFSTSDHYAPLRRALTELADRLRNQGYLAEVLVDADLGSRVVALSGDHRG